MNDIPFVLKPYPIVFVGNAYFDEKWQLDLEWPLKIVKYFELPIEEVFTLEEEGRKNL